MMAALGCGSENLRHRPHQAGRRGNSREGGAHPSSIKKQCRYLPITFPVSNLVAERQRRYTDHRSGGQYFADGICKFQSYWRTVAKDAGVIVQLRQRNDVLKHNPYLSVSSTYLHRERVWHLPAGIGLQSGSPALGPEISFPRTDHMGEPSKHGVLAFPVKLQVRIRPNAHTDHIG